MDWSGKAQLAATPLTNITLAGKPIAAVQNVNNFSFARVYAAGHEVVSTSPFPLIYWMLNCSYSLRSSPQRR